MNIEQTITRHVITALKHAGCTLAAVDDGERKHPAKNRSLEEIWQMMLDTEDSTLCFTREQRSFWMLIQPFGQEDCITDGTWPNDLDPIVWGAYNDALEELIA